MVILQRAQITYLLAYARAGGAPKLEHLEAARGDIDMLAYAAVKIQSFPYTEHESNHMTDIRERRQT